MPCSIYQDDMCLSCDVNEGINLLNDLESNTANIYTNFDHIRENKGFKVLHLNAADLYGKIDQLRDIMSEINAHVLSLNETYLDDSITNDELLLTGLTVHRRDRNRNGGGVALYVHDSLTPSLLDVDGEVESVWVSITTQGKKFIVGSIYRPPSSYVITGKSFCYSLN